MARKKIHLDTIPRIREISREIFYETYVVPQKPVIVERFTTDWNAYNLWTLDYIKAVAGEKMVPLYDNRIPINNSSNKFNEPHLYKTLAEYIDDLKKGPTPYRIFLYNLLKKVPALQQDFNYPCNTRLRFLKKLPMLFFGGENSKVFMHYDIDYANILHFHFDGEKECILFPPSETKYLYKLPNALIAYHEIDFENPDFEKFPALLKAKGMVANIKHGDMLYMPEGYWHQMTYKTPGFSMSLRALPISKYNLSKAVYNVFIMRHFDNLMRRIGRKTWVDYKNKKAVARTNKKWA
ncbi:cupin-like domain-containing protein [Aquimarina agarilytica]|uniref:cupin-like domain-containing protein n=1 Tax=Aquimarina agarilytica TaxID=1087449 RepID=UPI000287EBA9|nr:cupin-like domain-containing protein [Aquimarina agarilytica]